MHSLQNDLLKITINETGAELSNISSVKNNTSFMWEGNPKVWGGIAPNLFPVIGALKDSAYFFNNKKFNLPKHGFIRNNDDIKLIDQTEDRLTFKLKYSDTYLKMYPFKFEFTISYILEKNRINVEHTVNNLGDDTMYFSLGGHPAFKCPVYENESYHDYSLVFEQKEHAKTHLINMENGLISNKTEIVLNNSDRIALTHNLFSKDALVFKDLKSRRATLKSSKSGEVLSVNFKDFSYLGIWAKTNGDFVCIEPWLGVADNENTNQNFIEKEGILSLEPKKHFTAAYQIEVHLNHLE